MQSLAPTRLLASFAAALLFAPSLFAQAPPPNTDILKMIQAGLPESSVVDKIHQNAGHWDTSVDALISLKKAGATDAEIKALTAAVATPSSVASPGLPIVIAGGLLLRTQAGDPYLKFPERETSIFWNAEQSNTARLVAYDGKVGVSIPTDFFGPGPSASGDLIFTNNALMYIPHLLDAGYWYPSKGKYKYGEKDLKFVKEDTFTMPLSAVVLKVRVRDKVGAMYLEGRKGDFFIGWHRTGFAEERCVENNNCTSTSPGLQSFVFGLIDHFDETLAPFLRAAGITDANTQLTLQAHVHTSAPDDYAKDAAIYQAQLDRTPPPNQSSGGFMSGLAGTLAVVSAGANVLQANQSGNVAAAVNAQETYSQTVAQAVNGDNAGATTTASNGIANAQSTIAASTPQDALNQQLGNINAAPRATSGTANPKGMTFTENLPNGDIRKSTTVGVQGAYTITVQCFTHNSSTPYFNYSRSGPSEFFQNVPPCSGSPTVASAPAPPPPSNTVAPPVAYQPPPSTGGTVVAPICPANGFTGQFTSYGDAAVAIRCSPGQPIAASTTTATNAGSATSGDIVSGLNQCVAESFTLLHPGDTVPFLTFTNGCAQSVRLTWIVGPSGTPRGHTFAIGEVLNQTGSDQNDVHNQGGVTFYACPADHPVAVDPNGNQILSPVSIYKCAKHS